MLRKLTLEDYYCHKQFEADFKAGINCIIGKNGKGKGHPLNYVIPTPFGEMLWGNLCVGDYLYGRDGNPTRIIAIHDRGELPTYIVKFKTGAEIEVDGDHVWAFDCFRREEHYDYRSLKTMKGKAHEIATRDIKDASVAEQKSWRLPVIGAIEPVNPIIPEIDPYTLGYLIASDAVTGIPMIQVHKSEERVIKELLDSPTPPTLETEDVEGDFWHYGYWEESRTKIVNYLVKVNLIRKTGIFSFLPASVFKYSSLNRLRLLQGLMDKSGAVRSKGDGAPGAVFYTTSKILCGHVIQLVSSLGGEAQTFQDRYDSDGKVWYAVTIYMRTNPFLGSVHVELWEKSNSKFNNTALREFVSVEATNQKKEIRCVTVEAEDGIYLCDPKYYTPTHNSSCVSALYTALTAVHEHPEGARGSVRQGAECAKIKAEFDGFTVSRTIGEKNKHQLVVGKEKWSAAKEIEVQLAHRFGIVRGVVDRFMFIRQDRFTEIISQTDSERLKTLAYLANVDHFENLWKRLSEEVRLLEGQLQQGPSFDEQTVLAQVDELSERLTRSKAELTNLEEQIAPMEAELPKLEANLALLTSLENAEETLASNRAQSEKLAEDVKQASEKLVQKSKEYDELEASYKSLKLTHEEQVFCIEFARYEQQLVRIEALESELVTVEAELASLDVEKINTELQGLESKERELNDRSVRLQLQLGQARNSVRDKPCEVCGAAPEYQFKGNPEVIQSTLHKVSEAYDNVKLAIREANNSLRSHEHCTSRKSTITAMLGEVDVQKMEAKRPEVVALKEQEEKCKQVSMEMIAARNMIITLENNLKNLSGHAGALKQTLLASEQLVDNKQDILVNAGSAKCRILELDKLKTEHTALKATVEADEKHLVNLQALLAQLDRKLRQEKMLEYVELLNEVRNMSHRTGVPQVVSKRFLACVLTGLNELLVQMDAPFKASIGEDLSFRALMHSGASVPASALSGGQKAVYALAWWLSSFQSQAGRLETLVVDEPGQGLDLANRTAFNKVLERMDSIIAKQGRQLILISHDEALTDLFYTIEL